METKPRLVIPLSASFASFKSGEKDGGGSGRSLEGDSKLLSLLLRGGGIGREEGKGGGRVEESSPSNIGGGGGREEEGDEGIDELSHSSIVGGGGGREEGEGKEVDEEKEVACCL